MINAYKLFCLRKDGTLGPLFIGPRIRVPIGQWIKAEAIRTKGFAFRHGWHCCAAPYTAGWLRVERLIVKGEG